MKKETFSISTVTSALHRAFAGGSLVALAAVVIVTNGCGLMGSDADRKQWNASGVLALSRAVPEVGSKPVPQASSMLGFMPNRHSQPATSLVIHRGHNQIELTVAGRPSRSFKIEGATHLQPGVYALQLKQQDPLWYAPTSYFTARDLETPGEGDRERFRRGALGSHVIFIDSDTPIHNGPLWSEEVGGIRMDSEGIQALFDSLEVGARVEVR